MSYVPAEGADERYVSVEHLIWAAEQRMRPRDIILSLYGDCAVAEVATWGVALIALDAARFSMSQKLRSVAR